VNSVTPDNERPTVFHVTHYKAGSQWIQAILRGCVESDLVRAKAGVRQFLEEPIQPGKVYSSVYVTREQFESVAKPEGSRRFVIIRDLRDTVVSGYFSLKVSHGAFAADRVSALRRELQEGSVEEGLILTMDQWLTVNANIQRSWLESGEPVIRYEDLLENDVDILERVLIDECGYPVPRPRLRRAVETRRFERMSKGRQRGHEDVSAHLRKGVAGDWRTYFTEPVKEAFKERWGELLVRAGYERDLDW
jgi:lipopolysaccharide transport system ATP-binding protein